ncbi:chemotaxis response regulator protein-glutamate methylesterase [Pseudorhodoplanes sp.]|uniref:protein-glutamate methylesterase/protein-glutamine glutaminase n=1 Tax=Pseudorhodoplanes sp. TaxID=1934341 RepID=UPI00391C8473
MLVDDSAVARGFIRRWVEAEPDIVIVASLHTGREAIEYLDRVDPDVVVLDVAMPDMDGITVLPLLLRKKPGLAVIMASTLTRKNAEVTMRALSLGAVDCIQKPDAQGVVTSEDYRQALITKFRELGARTRRRLNPRAMLRPVSMPAPRERPVLDGDQRALVLRSASAVTPRVLVIGSSTGGPQALNEVCCHLGAVIETVPVLIAQHMPPTFTTILAEHLARVTAYPAREAEDGEPLLAGRIYVAPGHRHLRIGRINGQAVARLDDSGPVHFCKPSVDVLFSSAAAVFGAAALGVVLTGMGTDGLDGGRDIVEAGGTLLAQDESTSVVWGMPGSVAEAGLCSRILPLPQIAPAILQAFGRPA